MVFFRLFGAYKDSEAKADCFMNIGTTNEPNPRCLTFVRLVLVLPIQIFLLKRTDY